MDLDDTSEQIFLDYTLQLRHSQAHLHSPVQTSLETVDFTLIRSLPYSIVGYFVFFHFIDQLGIGYDWLRGHRVIEVRFRHKCDFDIERTLSQAKALLTVLAMLYKHYI